MHSDKDVHTGCSLVAAQVRRFMPFLEGSRQCIGMSLARMTTAATVAALLSRFTFRLADDVRTTCRSL